MAQNIKIKSIYRDAKNVVKFMRRMSGGIW